MDLRDRIIESASVLFFQNGIKSMTMSDIANEMGISKRTLYEVFRDKEELLEICINQHMEKTKYAIQALVSNSEDVIDTMMQIYAYHLNQMRNVKSTLYDLKKYHSHIYKKIECKQKEDSYRLLPFLNKGVEQGLIRKDVNFEIILWLLKSQITALMHDDFFPMDKYSPKDFVQAIMLNFLRGIATIAGNEKIDMIIEKLEKKDAED